MLRRTKTGVQGALYENYFRSENCRVSRRSAEQSLREYTYMCYYIVDQYPGEVTRATVGCYCWHPSHRKLGTDKSE